MTTSGVSLSLEGHVAVVTGGGSGIGASISRRLAEAGAAVAVADRYEEAAKSVAGEITSNGLTAIGVTMDVTDPNSVEVARKAVVSEMGSASILVNNAGAWTIKRFADMNDDVLTRDMDVCLYGTGNGCRAFLPAMRERRDGGIVNIVSDAGRIGEPTMTTYSAAKGAVNAFTKALAKEEGYFNIRCNGVSPGTTRTPGNADVRASWDESKIVKMYPLRRLGEPQDHANAVLFLASDLSGWITGQVLSVNGGYATF